MDRKTFLRTTAILSAAASLQGPSILAAHTPPVRNKLPYWKGFNLTDFNTPQPATRRRFTTEAHLQWIADWGFNFVRLPVAYPYYLRFDRSKPITPEEVYQIDDTQAAHIDELIYLAHKHKLHVSLNLHRAPGYCVNAGFHEPYNLWKDEAAQKAFCYHWGFWAKRYRSVSADKLSFDLLNEPSMREDMNNQLSPAGPVLGDTYRRVAKAALDAIRLETSDRLVIADGNNMGHQPIPELADLDIAQSCRGYFPHAISHYKAPWANKDPEHQPAPVYPGKIGGQEVNKAAIEAYYQPWVELQQKGVGLHCGECGSWNQTPHDVVLAWLKDLLGVLKEYGIGFALWEFIGDFGVLDSGREDVVYEGWEGYQLDRELLRVLQGY